jgi:metallophosphoesterase (TIGR03767 family)
MDTTNHFGGPNGSGGSLGEGQLRWLEQRLATHHRSYLAPDGSLVRSSGDDRLVVVFSHHTASTMDATDPDPAHPGERRILGEELVEVLLRYPNVVAWVNGHTHTNGLTAHRRADGRTSGFWEVNTASHVDWPQQARIVELVDNHDGTLSIFGTMIEHAAPAAAAHDATDHLGLAAIARELGANDAQAGPEHKAGTADVRNVELVLRAPFARPGEGATTTTTTPATAPPAATPVAGAPAYTG